MTVQETRVPAIYADNSDKLDGYDGPYYEGGGAHDTGDWVLIDTAVCGDGTLNSTTSGTYGQYTWTGTNATLGYNFDALEIPTNCTTIYADITSLFNSGAAGNTLDLTTRRMSDDAAVGVEQNYDTGGAYQNRRSGYWDVTNVTGYERYYGDFRSGDGATSVDASANAQLRLWGVMD